MLEDQCGILLVDDEPAWLRSMQMLLTRSTGARHIIACSDSREALSILEKEDIGLVLLDLTMPHISGEAMLTAIQEKHPDVLVIIITGMNTADKALQCLKAGAFDYFVKTWGEERLLTGIAHALRVASLEKTRRETSRSILSEELAHPDAFHNIITASTELFTIFRYMESVLPSRYPFLITGESGVGKELVARAAHTLTGARGRFVSINMASLEGSMLEDTLFGHVKGAYTNASGARAGLVEQAQGGTLFLDEIGELSLQSQARLLRFLQEGEYYPIGADSPKKVAAHIVLATNRDIKARQHEGQFRKDLYFRLSTHHVHIPPLRERREDIPLLIRAFIQEAADVFACPVPHLSKEVLLALMQYSYLGNVRELKAMLTHAVSLNKTVLEQADFPGLFEEDVPALAECSPENALLKFFLSMETFPPLPAVKQIMTTAALIKSDGNQSVAARLLGISQPAMSKRVNS
jgi:DNA-binding NtrC family response regulator